MTPTATTPTVASPEAAAALGALVSFFPSAFTPEPTEQLPLLDVLERIRAGIWGEPLVKLRRHLERQNEKGYQEAKRTLPAFTMSGACLTRDAQVQLAEKFLSHSGVLQCDFDRKDNPALDLSSTGPLLRSDPYLIFGFVSPSGGGLKCGLLIDGTRHGDSFAAAEAYFLKTYGLQIDKSTKDPLRLCFVSSDEDLWLNDTATALPIPEQVAPARAAAWHPPLESTAADLREMLKFIPSRPDYDTWLRIASAVWSAVGLEEGCQLLNEWSPEEKHGEYVAKHRARLAQIGVGTLVHYAAQNGFDARAAAFRKNWCGRIRFADSPRHKPTDESLTADPSAEIRHVELTRKFIAECLNDSQLGDARLWQAIVHGRKLYDHFAKSWRTYENGIWAKDEMSSTIIECADAIAMAYKAQIASVREDIAKRPPPPEVTKDARAAVIKKFEGRVEKLYNRSYIVAVLAFAESLLGTKATLYDRKPHLLCVENGVVDFSEGVFREHRPSDMITMSAGYTFNPDAQCTKWAAFLDFAFSGNRELIAYLARSVGNSLTGFVDKDVMHFLYGSGANGKSTFTALLKMLAGEYMVTIGIEALLAKQADNNFDYKKAMLEGKRICVTDEIPESRTLNDSAIKALVGGDTITARRPYEKPYNFEPTHKLWLVGNHKPEIKGTDHGIWRRIHLIPWLNTIPPEKRRPRHEILAELRAELPAILNWALRGYLDMADGGGLNPPPAVLAAVKDYQDDSDQVAQFLEERTERSTADEVLASRLLKTYLAWCEDNGESPRYRSSRKLCAYLRERAWAFRVNGDRQQVVQGLRIIEAN